MYKSHSDIIITSPSSLFESEPMKSFIRKSLLALVGASALAFGAVGCSHHSGPRQMGEPGSADFRAKMVDRVASKLELNEMQKQKFSVLATKMQEQRASLMGSNQDPRAQAKAVIAGNTFDKAKAQVLIDEKTLSIKSKSPEVIAAAADFFDTLNPTQQQQVRDFMNRGRGWRRN
jgi:periplasmic protein CpxP/Spy